MSHGYGPDEENSFHTLYKKIVTVFHTQNLRNETIRELQGLLAQHKQSLLNPLSKKKPSTEDRRKIENNNVFIRGVKANFTDEEKKYIIRVSDELQLNEIECIHLVSAARHYFPKMGTDLLSAATELFYEERQRLLLSLLTLIQGRSDETISPASRDLFASFVYELVNEGLMNNLCSIIQELNKTTKQHEYLNTERKTIAECIFYICYDIQLSSDTLTQLVKTLKSTCEVLYTTQDNELFRIAYLLVFSIMCAIDYTELIDAINGEVTKNKLFNRGDFIIHFEKEFYDESLKDFQSIIAIQWALSLSKFLEVNSDDKTINYEEKLEKAWKFSKDYSVFNLITQIVDHKIFQNDNKEFLISVLSDLVTNILSHMNKRLLELMGEEEDSARNSLIEGEKVTVVDHFEQFMQMIASIYRGFPEFGKLFFEKNTRPNQFITKQACDFITTLSQLYGGIHYPSFVAYMDVLSSLSGDSESAYYTFQILAQYSYPWISWEYFFGMMKELRDSYANIEETERKLEMKPLSMEEELILLSILQLTEQVAKTSPEARQFLLENIQLDVLGTLFGISTSCPFSPKLMGQLYKTLAAFAKSSQVVVYIWSHLESIQIYKPDHGIKSQLEEVESRAEEYPETNGFIELIKELIQHGIPHSLGQEYRIPGFGPYLQFIRDDVFVKFDIRMYKNPGEKWIIASNALEILLTILEHYEVHPDDFITKVKPPGFEIMKDMLSVTELREKIFSLVRRGVESLEKERFSLKEGIHYEKAVLSALNMMKIVLENQDDFRIKSMQKQKQQPIIPIPLDKAIVRTIIVPLSMYMGYPYSAQMRYLSVNILYLISQAEHKLVGIFEIANSHLALRRLFIKRLYGEDVDHLPEYFDEKMEGERAKEYKFENKMRNTILDLLITNIDAPQPNITQFLCGFDLNKPSKSVFTDKPGEENCLQVILDLVKNPTLPLTHPKLAEQCFEFIYKLVANPSTSAPTRAYLHRHEFFTKHTLGTQVIQEMKSIDYLKKHPEHYLNQRSYIMKTVALEIFAAKDNHKNRASIQENINILFSNGPKEDWNVPTNFEQQKIQMLELLDAIDITIKDRPEPIQPFLNVSIEDCLQRDERGLQYYNVKMLHSMLTQAKYSIEQEGVATTTLEKANEEISNIIEKAIHWNIFFKKYMATCNAFEGWKQVVEITLSTCYEMLESEHRERILYDILMNLLSKLSLEGIIKSIESSISQVILRCMTKLREQRFPIETNQTPTRLPVDQCLTLLQEILNSIMRQKTLQTTRGNLYATLLNYLQYTRKLPTLSLSAINLLQENNLPTFIIEEESQDLLEKGNAQILNSYDHLIARISRDALDGRSVWKAVSFATLDTLFIYDKKAAWIQYIERSGTLQQFLDHLSSLEKSLLDVLSPEATSLNKLYIYENLMSFLLRLSQTKLGSESLTKFGIFQILNHCKFIDIYPNDYIYGEEEDDGWGPSVVDRYHQLLIPALQLVVSIFANLRKNTSVASQVLSFMSNHQKTISHILKNRILNVKTCEEVRLITNLFYLLAQHSNLLNTKKLPIAKFESLLLSLLPNYKHRCKRDLIEEDSQIIDEHVREICRNVIGYCRMITDHTLFDNLNRILFTPSFDDQRSFKLGGPPSLNVLKLVLEENLENINHAIKTRHQTQRDLEQIDQQWASIETNKSRFMTELNLSNLLMKTTHQIKSYTYIIENTLLILYRYLNHFLKSESTISEDIHDHLMIAPKLQITKQDAETLAREADAKLKVLDKIFQTNQDELKSDFIHFLIQNIQHLLISKIQS